MAEIVFSIGEPLAGDVIDAAKLEGKDVKSFIWGVLETHLQRLHDNGLFPNDPVLSMALKGAEDFWAQQRTANA